MKPRGSEGVRCEKLLISDQGAQLGPLGDQLGPGHRRVQPRAKDSVVRLGDLHIEIRRIETGLGKGIRQSSRPPKKPHPANARQRNPTDLERPVD